MSDYDVLRKRILETKISNLIRERKLVSQNKAHLEINELYDYAQNEKGITFSNKLKAQLEQIDYEKRENNFIDKVLKALSQVVIRKDERENELARRNIGSLYEEYCSDVKKLRIKQRESFGADVEIDSEEVQTLNDSSVGKIKITLADLKSIIRAEEKKRDSFTDEIFDYIRSYYSGEILTEYVNELNRENHEGLKDFITSVSEVYGMSPIITTGVLQHLDGIYNPFVLQKGAALFNLYDSYRRETDENSITPLTDGVVNLSDSDYIVSNNGRASTNILVDTNKDAYMDISLGVDKTAYDKFKEALQEAKERYDSFLKSTLSPEETSEKVGQDIPNVDIQGILNGLHVELLTGEHSPEELEQLHSVLEKVDNSNTIASYGRIRRLAKKIAKLSLGITKEALIAEKIPEQAAFNEAFSDVQDVIYNADNMPEEEQLAILRKVDEKTPTETSDDLILELIDRINNPDDEITPREMLEELITEEEESLQDVVDDKHGEIGELVNRLSTEICSLLGFPEYQTSVDTISELLRKSIFPGKLDLTFKNPFIIPQLAKQLGIPTAVYYREINMKTNKESLADENRVIDNIANIFSDVHLIDDTKRVLCKRFVKINENFIRADSFCKKTNGTSIDMDDLLSSTERYIRNFYLDNLTEEKEKESDSSETPNASLPTKKDTKSVKAKRLKEAKEDFEEIRRGLIKQTIFNKLTNNTNEGNDTWGLISYYPTITDEQGRKIKSQNPRLKLTPLYSFRHSAGDDENQIKKARTVNNQHGIEEFILAYCDEEWFREWIEGAVPNLSLDKAMSDMYRQTKVELSRKEKEYYGEIFSQMKETIIHATQTGYDENEIKKRAREKRSLSQNIRYRKRQITGKFYGIKDDIARTTKKIKKGKKKDDDLAR